MRAVSRARIVWTGPDRRRREHRLDAQEGAVRVGRHPSCEIWIDVRAVSRCHLLLTAVGDTWFVEDVSVAGAEHERRERTPLRSRRSLHSGDRLHVGGVVLTYADEDEPPLGDTVPHVAPRVPITAGEQAVLRELCRPALERDGPPASNQQVADALTLSVEGVRSHLKSMYGKFELARGTPGQRRIALVRRAIGDGYVFPD
jgi:predicted component of type VI protein secretion system